MAVDPQSEGRNTLLVLAQFCPKCSEDDNHQSEALETALHAKALKEAERFGLKLEVVHTGQSRAVQMDSQIQEVIKTAAEALELRTRKLSSGAGHDAQILAKFTPSGMILVPSVAGISHSPRELTNWGDCINGANALLHSVINLANLLH